MKKKMLMAVHSVDSNVWHNVKTGTTDGEIKFENEAKSIGFDVFHERIVDHRNKRKRFIQITLERILEHKINFFGRYTEWYLCIPHTEFLTRSPENIRKKIINQFIVKTFDEIEDEYSRFLLTKKRRITARSPILLAIRNFFKRH